MNIVDGITILVATLAHAGGVWIVFRFTKPVIIKLAPKRVAIAIIVLTAIVCFGVWSGSGGEWRNPPTIYYGLLVWATTVYLVAVRPRKLR